jgi:hypothetical protein
MRRPGRPCTRRLANKGPITRAFLDALHALLWGFHNSRTGCCFPSYERIAERAECDRATHGQWPRRHPRSTVTAALKALEWAGVLTWQHRLARVRERCTDLFGRESWRWPVIRTSNAYAFRDAMAVNSRGVRLPDSAQPWQQRQASNKGATGRSEPMNQSRETNAMAPQHARCILRRNV